MLDARSAFAHWFVTENPTLLTDAFAVWNRATAGATSAQAEIARWLAASGIILSVCSTDPAAPCKLEPRPRGRPAHLGPIAAQLALVIGEHLASTQIRLARYADLTLSSSTPLTICWRLRSAGPGWAAGEIELAGARAEAMVALVRYGRTALPAPDDYILRGPHNGLPCRPWMIRHALARGRRELAAAAVQPMTEVQDAIAPP